MATAKVTFCINAPSYDVVVDDYVTLHNLSEGGIFFVYKEDLGIGTLLELGIDLSKSTFS